MSAAIIVTDNGVNWKSVPKHPSTFTWPLPACIMVRKPSKA